MLPVNAAAKTALADIKKLRCFGEDNPILSQADGTPNTTDNFTRSFESIIKRAGIEHGGIHTQRHTFAPQLIAKGTDVKTMSLNTRAQRSGALPHTLWRQKIVMIEITERAGVMTLA